MKTNLNNRIGLQVLMDKKVVSIQKACRRILEIRIQPPELSEKVERSPLNLALVLDRSGSMQGEKLQYAKQAAAHVLDLLGEKDKAAIIIYDDEVECLFAAENMNEDNKLTAKNRLAQVRAGNSTNLAGGWLRGCEEAARVMSGTTINRCLLLTDGLANVGITNPRELGQHARELLLRGISTSCFGVGLGYDEHLLELMANQGGGNFYFLETLNAIPLVFEREFKELAVTTLREAIITIQLNSGVQAAVSAGYQYQRERDEIRIELGNLYSGVEKSVYLSLDFDGINSKNKMDIPVQVSGKDGADLTLSEKTEITVDLIPEGDESRVAPDAALISRFAKVDLADKTKEALKKEREGNREEASKMMQDTLAMYAANVPAGTIYKYNQISEELKTGMDEANRKQRHYEQYLTKRGRTADDDPAGKEK